MKKILVAFALAAVATSASAVISGGSHDLTVAYGTALPACQYCHTPHLWVASNVVGGPLWNRNAAATTIYSAYTRPGFVTTVALGAATRTCLSCHDGNAFGAVNNGTMPGTSAADTIATISTGGAYANVGTNLTDDHPVGVVYTVGTQYADVSANTNVKLYAGQVECGSCHEPHSLSDGARGGTFFARWGAVDLCAQCHLK
ncbi:MAG: hypothetical protein WCC48_06895 [Anaeromyxobacteraceae bacterium]